MKTLKEVEKQDFPPEFEPEKPWIKGRDANQNANNNRRKQNNLYNGLVRNII